MDKAAEAGPSWAAPDWSRPWLGPVAAQGRAVRRACEAGQCLPDALTQQWLAQQDSAPGRMRFVPQTELPQGVAYEQHIFDTGCVPTREGLHDFFNGLCWMRYPLTKSRLNHLQAAQIAQAGGVGQVRGAVRDALTLFDENAALLQAPQAVWTALLARDWQRLFVELRPQWAAARLVLFGHALMEKLVMPYKSITAHVFRVPVPQALGADLSRWDAWLAGQLDASRLASKPFTPLPVLGVPGWWAASEDPAFYNDTSVFRVKNTSMIRK